MRGIALGVGVVLALLLAAEGAFRVVDFPERIEFGWGGVRDHYSYGGEDFVIVLLGDSQVRNRGEKRTLPLPGEMLELLLNYPAHTGCRDSRGATAFRVVTIGSGGWGQDQQLLALTRYFRDHRADLVVLWQTPENDIWNNAFPTHYPLNGTPKPTFVLDSHGELRKVSKREIVPYWMETRLGLLVYMAAEGLEEYLQGEAPWLTRLRPESGLHRKLWNPDRHWDRYLPPPATAPGAAHFVDGADALPTYNPVVYGDPIYLEKSHFAVGLNEGSERIAWMVRLTNRLIRELERLANRHESVFFTFSYDADGTEQPLYPPDGHYVFRGQRFSFSNAVKRQRLEQINRGVPHHEITLTIDRWRKRRNNPHLSGDANEMVMDSLANIVIERICSDE